MTVCVLAHAEVQSQALAVSVGFTQKILRINQPTELSDNKKELKSYPLNGPQIGILYDMTFKKGLGMTVGLNYSYTTKISDWEDYKYDRFGKVVAVPIIETKYRNESHVLKLHADLQYKAPIAMDTWLIFYTGPSIQGVLKYNANDYYREKKIIESSDDKPVEIVKYRSDQRELSEYYNVINVTWGVGAGFQYKHIFVRGGYDFGLTNPRRVNQFGKMGYMDPADPSQPDNRLTRGRADQWQITVGYYFWQRDKE